MGSHEQVQGLTGVVVEVCMEIQMSIQVSHFHAAIAQ
jgi:hypothetical protein